MRTRIAIVGLGLRGVELAHAFGRLDRCKVARLCDPDETARRCAEQLFPGIPVRERIDDLLADPTVDAIVLATPSSTHAGLAERALAAGKHCYVESPLALSLHDAGGALAAARQSGRVLMVGHELAYHPGVVRLRELIDAGQLGALCYVQADRCDRTRPRGEENVLWSAGVDEVALVLALAGEEPCDVEAQGAGYLRDGIEEVVFGFLRFPSGLRCHLHCTWLAPGERRLTVVGTRRVATLDDHTLALRAQDFDAVASGHAVDSDGHVEKVAVVDRKPLAIQCEHFVACIRQRTSPRTDGEAGVRVVRVLAALQDRLDVHRPLRADRSYETAGV